MNENSPRVKISYFQFLNQKKNFPHVVIYYLSCHGFEQYLKRSTHRQCWCFSCDLICLHVRKIYVLHVRWPCHVMVESKKEICNPICSMDQVFSEYNNRNRWERKAFGKETVQKDVSGFKGSSKEYASG